MKKLKLTIAIVTLGVSCISFGEPKSFGLIKWVASAQNSNVEFIAIQTEQCWTEDGNKKYCGQPKISNNTPMNYPQTIEYRAPGHIDSYSIIKARIKSTDGQWSTISLNNCQIINSQDATDFYASIKLLITYDKFVLCSIKYYPETPDLHS